jgi:putative alpha-1,2-mannosidase
VVRTRKLIGPVFNIEKNGLPGNDDAGISIPLHLTDFLGSLGAYLVWIMSGLVPIAGQSVYLILPPSFSEVQWTVTGSRIIAHNFGPGNEFIQNVIVDGQPVPTGICRS